MAGELWVPEGVTREAAAAEVAGDGVEARLQRVVDAHNGLCGVVSGLQRQLQHERSIRADLERRVAGLEGVLGELVARVNESSGV
jgi:hypothetical protein